MNFEIEWDVETKRARVIFLREAGSATLFCEVIGIGEGYLSLQVAPVRDESQ